MQGDETYAADSLIDVGPAPPLPDKSEFGLGPSEFGHNPGGGGGSFPPQGAPFNYPSPSQPQQPGAYPNGGVGASSAPFLYPGGAIGGVPSNHPPAMSNNSEKNLLGKLLLNAEQQISPLDHTFFVGVIVPSLNDYS